MRATRHTRRYAMVMLATLVAASLIAAAINTRVDPFRTTGAPWASAGADSYRDISASTRTGKAGLIRSHADWQVGIFGSSRVISSLDPDAPGWAGKKAVNLGMPGAFLYENIAMAEYFLAKQPAEILVFGIDPGDLTNSIDTRPMVDFVSSPLNPDGVLDRELRYIFGMSTLETSLETLGLQWKKTPAEYNSRGFRDRPGGTGGGGAASPGKGQLNFIKNRFVDDARVPKKPGEGTKVFPKKAEPLEAMMRHAREKGARLILFLHPNHVLLQAKSADIGNAEVPFETDRRALVEMVHRVNSTGNGPEVELWDFYSYHPYNRERVRPIEGQPSELVHWRDLEHFTKDVGEAMLSQLMAWEIKDPKLSGYGTRLTPENVESRITELRQAYQVYLQDEKDGDLAWKEDLVKKGLGK
ncbi:hypothetical protein OJ996_09610 [Luteolibacter sp. GHJ8]|uniref:GDSL-like lipase/acylhydrolase family protein n=1 Tax=Luteolibacter rhizosphaerae TaxID=2989719 RepID=A0ABT3G2E9_9BACT|nr:hypothetical protein [Luteolibacter rhizosphaerae]MCW1913832.1 hypothetical protein [Luteolibacter rhizosphaerae]